ncbi:hypothetical protein GCM10018965_001590 [Nonomuraea roseola]
MVVEAGTPGADERVRAVVRGTAAMRPSVPTTLRTISWAMERVGQHFTERLLRDADEQQQRQGEAPECRRG